MYFRLLTYQYDGIDSGIFYLVLNTYKLDYKRHRYLQDIYEFPFKPRLQKRRRIFIIVKGHNKIEATVALKTISGSVNSLTLKWSQRGRVYPVA